MNQLRANHRTTPNTAMLFFFTEGLKSSLVVLACAGLLVTGAEAQTSDTTFNVSATFADKNSTPLVGTVTINTSTGAIDGFAFNIPTMTIGSTTLPGAVFTPQTATAGFFTNPSEIVLQLKGAPLYGESLFLFIPQVTLTEYPGGSLLQSVFLNGQTYNTGYQSGAQSNPFIGIAGNGLVSSGDITFNVSATFADNNATPLTGTVTINTATGAIDGFDFAIPSMTVGTTVVPGLNLTPSTATASFGPTCVGTGTDFGLDFNIKGAPPGTEDLELKMPQTTLVGYAGGTILNSVPCSTFSGGTLFTGFADYGAFGGGFVKIIGSGTITETATNVPAGYAFCPSATGRGGQQVGQVYDPNTDSCVNGAVVPIVPPPGDLLCPAGPNGLGGIYNPSLLTCDQGAILGVGQAYCHAGTNGPGGVYYTSSETCDFGVILGIGQAYCRAGSNGPGGVYYSSTQGCDFGAILGAGQAYCNRGPNGPGGVYTILNQTCDNGVILGIGQTYCNAGPNGSGGAYSPGSYYCLSGAIVPLGDSYCPAGPNGSGGGYSAANFSCDLGAIVALGGSYCQAGPNGSGGAYSAANSSCDLGAIVPLGDLYCPAGRNGSGGAYSPATYYCNRGAIVPLGN